MFDVVIRNGTVLDGTGAPGRRADVAISGTHIAAIVPDIDIAGAVEIDADGRYVTPGFVDVHTHLDAQLAWDPIGSSSCWHGVTSAVLGNCGVTFAPVRNGDREVLAEMMESVEDIPRDAILDGLPWDWNTYGEYLAFLDRLPKGLNVGGMVGHCAVRYHAMGERSLDETPASADDIERMCALVDEAIGSGALGFSTSRTLLHRVPDGRPVPGTHAAPDELLAIADVLGRHHAGVFGAAPRLGERDDAALTNTRVEVALLAELSRRSGRPVTFGLTQSNRRPSLYQDVIDMVRREPGAHVRPQTTARGVGVLFGLHNRTPFDRFPAWRALRDLSLADRLGVLRDPVRRAELVAEADGATGTLDGSSAPLDPREMYVIDGPDARYDCRPEDSLAAHAERRGTTAADAFIALSLESEGRCVVNYPFLNQSLDAVAEMLTEPLVTLGLADAGAHVGQIMDSSQPTFLLTYWVRERQMLSIQEAIRRLTSDTAMLFGVHDRGVLRPGAFADVNVIDLEGLRLPPPAYVHDFPNGAGRYVQGSTGYDYTLVNGQVVVDHGVHTGALPGKVLRSHEVL